MKEINKECDAGLARSVYLGEGGTIVFSIDNSRTQNFSPSFAGENQNIFNMGGGGGLAPALV
jgi:hypothetical protein